MSFELRFTQTGINRDLALAQRNRIIENMVSSVGGPQSEQGRSILQVIRENIIQIPSMTRQLEKDNESTGGRFPDEMPIQRRIIEVGNQYWSNYSRKTRGILNSYSGLIRPDRIMAYLDFEPGVDDLDDDGVHDDRFMSCNYDPDANLRLVVGGMLGEMRSTLESVSIESADLSVWSLAKAPRGNPTGLQLSTANGYLSRSGCTWVCINGYPYLLPSSPGWSTTYLGDSYRKSIESWQGTTHLKLFIAFQSRSRHRNVLNTSVVYHAARAAAEMGVGMLWWMQAETEAQVRYWETLNDPLIPHIARGIVDGILEASK